MLKKNEQVCSTCDGAGLMPSGKTFGVHICPGCNGHGVVVINAYHRVCKFDTSAETRTKLALVDGTDNDMIDPGWS
jgi:DnaJ-class molecular chaperone